MEGASLMLDDWFEYGGRYLLFSAFEPKHEEPDWSKVYPELSEEYEGPVNPTATKISNRPAGGDSPLLKIDEMLKDR
jgi:hypothetical protein